LIFFKIKNTLKYNNYLINKYSRNPKVKKKEKEKKKVPMEWSSAVHKSSLVLYATISSSKSGMVKRWQFNDGNYYTCQYYLV
jgi:hypothetical protein